MIISSRAKHMQMHHPSENSAIRQRALPLVSFLPPLFPPLQIEREGESERARRPPPPTGASSQLAPPPSDHGTWPYLSPPLPKTPPSLPPRPSLGVQTLVHPLEMARSPRGRRLLSCPLRSAQDQLLIHHQLNQKGCKPENHCKAIKNDWEKVTCSVCMEYPHNAVLLLCCSHEKGCRPYMCGTNYRFSNCLVQFQKAYTKTENAAVSPSMSNLLLKNKSEMAELACPLCRGQVKGWTVVEAARDYLNKKKRSCTQDGCSFVGNYKQLRKHVKAVHRSCRPHQVDPVLEEKWKTFQDEREREDVMSMITSSMPGAMVLGDYVIENGDSDSNLELFDEEGDHRDWDSRNWLRFLWLLRTFGDSRSSGLASRLSFRAGEEDHGRRSSRFTPSAFDLPLFGDASHSEADALIHQSDIDDSEGDEPSVSTRRSLLSRVRLLASRNGRSRNGTNSRRRLRHSSP